MTYGARPGGNGHGGTGGTGGGREEESPEFPDCRALGATYEQALANLRDLIRIYVEDGLGDDEPVPQHEELSFTTLSF